MSKKKKLNYKKNICMIVQNPMVKGGIAAVVNGYRDSQLGRDFNIIYLESYCDGNKIRKFFKGMVGYLHFIKVLYFDNIDIVHIHSSFGPSFYRKLPFIYMSNILKKPIINHIHGAEFDDFYVNASNNKKMLISKAYNKCDMIIALSDEWKEQLSLIVPKERITVIENYSRIAENVIRYKCNYQVLFLGMIGHRKGCYDIPEVIENVIKEFPCCKFVIAGDGEIEEIKSHLVEKGVEKNVIFPGWVRGEEKDRLLRESDVFFLPSYNEGMPMSILDAMGYGLPIISTTVGGIPKIVHDGENGYTYKPGDVEGFSRGLKDLLRQEDLLLDFGKESMQIVMDKYSLEYHIHLLSLLYGVIKS